MAVLRLNTFAGMVTREDTKDINPNACFQAKNITHIAGKYKSRAGTFSLTAKTSPFTGGRCNLIYHFQKVTGENQILVGNGTRIDVVNI